MREQNVYDYFSKNHANAVDYTKLRRSPEQTSLEDFNKNNKELKRNGTKV